MSTLCKSVLTNSFPSCRRAESHEGIHCADVDVKNNLSDKNSFVFISFRNF